MNTIKKPIYGFLILFTIFHIILFGMRSEHQVFWHLYTGLMLFSSIGYIFYERNIHSKRLLDAIITGILASFVIVILYTFLSFIMKDITYFHLLKVIVGLGVYVKWQLIISLFISIPLQELFFRNMLQNYLDDRFNQFVSACIISLCVTSLFMYSLSIELLLFIFLTQFILALSYHNTKRLITPIIGQIFAIIILTLIHR